MGTRDSLPYDVARCFGKLEGDPPGVPVEPCDTCARFHFRFKADGGARQAYFTTYPRSLDGSCVRHISMQLPPPAQQELLL